jgi:hypothetical protein
MARSSVAEARRSQLVSTYGVGALFPAEDESFMLVGLDDWKEHYCPEVTQPRLARSLGVRTFRMPPSGGRGAKDLPVVRFPRIHHCASCKRLDYLNKFCGWDDHVCHDCQRTLTPSRFVICCPDGHIDDFPYFAWAHRGQEFSEGKAHKLSMRTRGQSSSLKDIVISCSCGVPSRTMAGSFGPQALGGVVNCAGQRPWLRNSASQDCEHMPRTLQRGSSNVWFASVRSALSIPPWSEGVHKILGQYWPVLAAIPAESLEQTLIAMQIPTTSGIPASELVSAILEMRGETSGEAPTEADLRGEEYQALLLGRPEVDPHQQFVCTPVLDLPDKAQEMLDRVSEVARLREVRALEGFTRVTPGGEGTGSGRMAALSREMPTWLPAIEVLGEGVFLQIREDRLKAWELTGFARDRAAAINASFEVRASQLGAEQPTTITAREILLHSFAHVLLTELSLDAGYPVASLRERVYWSAGQTGILIYTASSDSAGSLGGLSAQSEPDRIWAVVQSAIRRARWCSSDPVCIESTGSGADAVNLAACHACLLLPETSCERMNRVLDRATLVGRPGSPSEGFFHQFVQ